MAEMTAQREIQIPDGGIAGFMMSDEDFAELARQESERSFGNKGIAGFSDTATKMAALGRYGDDSLIHAQTGEIVVPKPVLDSNPELKQAIFDDMRARGIEDPERYVVGSETNSINPETGLMEFGFFSKVWRGVKKVASETVKTLKKIAPVVLPIAMTIMFPALGAYGAALGSGIGTLLQGGDLKDALKSAAISGLTAGAFQGFQNIGETGGFTAGFKGAFSNPGARFAQVGSGLKSGFSGQGWGDAFKKFATPGVGTGPSGNAPADARGADYAGMSDAEFQTVNNAGLTPEQVAARDLAVEQTNLSRSGYQTSGAPEYSLAGQADMTSTAGTNTGATSNLANTQQNSGTFMDKVAKAWDNTTEFFMPSGKSAEDVRALQAAQYKKDIAAGLPPELALQNASAITGEPSFLAKYGPMTALLGTGAYAAGMFDEPEPEPSPLGLESGPTAEEIIAANPDKYRVNIGYAPPTYFQPYTQYQSFASLPVNYGLGSSTPGGTFQRPVGYQSPMMYAATGGEVYPRRNGGIMPNEGVPGKDSVRAMLMPGEFVMTTDAVRGAGDGDLNRGINNMYNVMANLERKGRMS